MEAYLAIIGIVVFAIIIFNIYLFFKILQFIIQAINLYKKMVNRQDAMLKLLLDIRDNTKKFENISSESINNLSLIEDDDTFVCEDCRTEVPANAKFCPKCGAQYE